MFDIVGLEQLNTLAFELEGAGVRVGVLGQVAVSKTAHDIEGTGKQFAPVDTGNLRSSIGTDLGVLQAAIGPTAAYGKFVEFGTSRMAPHAFMGPALDRHTPGFVTAVGELGAKGLLP